MKKLMIVVAAAAFSVNAFSASTVENNPLLVGDSFGFAEGPAWDAAHNRFLFSDIPNNKIYSYDLSGALTVADEDSGFSNGLDIDQNGNLWAARHDRKLSFIQADGDEVIVAATYNGKPLNSPNDVTVNSDGSVWFTDPPFGIQGYGPQKAEEEQPVRGIYRYLDGDFRLMSGELKLPNGLAFTPDGAHLYVADTSDGWVYRFDVNELSITNKTAFAQVESPQEGAEPMADGVEVDRNGTVYVAGPGGVGVFDAEGRQFDFIAVDAGHISNIELGGPDRNLLMVTAYNKVIVFTLRQ